MRIWNDLHSNIFIIKINVNCQINFARSKRQILITISSKILFHTMYFLVCINRISNLICLFGWIWNCSQAINNLLQISHLNWLMIIGIGQWLCWYVSHILYRQKGKRHLLHFNSSASLHAFANKRIEFRPCDDDGVRFYYFYCFCCRMHTTWLAIINYRK